MYWVGRIGERHMCTGHWVGGIGERRKCTMQAYSGLVGLEKAMVARRETGVDWVVWQCNHAFGFVFNASFGVQRSAFPRCCV